MNENVLRIMMRYYPGTEKSMRARAFWYWFDYRATPQERRFIQETNDVPILMG